MLRYILMGITSGILCERHLLLILHFFFGLAICGFHHISFSHVHDRGTEKEAAVMQITIPAAIITTLLLLHISSFLLSSSLPFYRLYGNGLSRQSLFFLYALYSSQRCLIYYGDKENQENSDGMQRLKTPHPHPYFILIGTAVLP